MEETRWVDIGVLDISKFLVVAKHWAPSSVQHGCLVKDGCSSHDCVSKDWRFL